MCELVELFVSEHENSRITAEERASCTLHKLSHGASRQSQEDTVNLEVFNCALTHSEHVKLCGDTLHFTVLHHDSGSAFQGHLRPNSGARKLLWLMHRPEDGVDLRPHPHMVLAGRLYLDILCGSRKNTCKCTQIAATTLQLDCPDHSWGWLQVIGFMAHKEWIVMTLMISWLFIQHYLRSNFFLIYSVLWLNTNGILTSRKYHLLHMSTLVLSLWAC